MPDELKSTRDDELDQVFAKAESLVKNRSKTTNQPPARRCACVSYDAHECIGIRYGRIDRFDAEDWEDDPCECACHAEFDDWNRDDDD